MIYDVMLNLGTGDISVDSNEITRSYTYDYLVITDHTDTPQDIYAEAKTHGLPIYGSVSKTGVKLSSITIDRWDQNNAKSVPSYNLPAKSEGSYAIWKYEVTYSDQKNSGGGSRSDSDVDFNEAYNFNASVKEYQERTNLCYAVKQNKEPKTGAYSSRSVLLKNILGQNLMLDTVLRNLTISFDFKIRKSKLDDWISGYIPEYVGTVNSDAVTVAGLKLKPYRSKLIAMTASASDNQDQAVIHAQIQVTIQKPVAMQEFGNLSFYARPAGQKIEKRVQKFIGTKQQKDSLTGAVWFNKQHNIGNFENAKLAGAKLKRGDEYQDYDNKVVLDKNGQYYNPSGGVDEQANLDDPNIGRTYAVTAPVIAWSSLSLPKRLH